MTHRIALVTGTSAGIGAAVAEQLLADGWTVVGMARRPVSFAAPAYRHLALDLADVDAACAAIEREAGPLVDQDRWSRTALVNNAADGGLLGPTERIDARALQRLLAVNVAAPIWLMGFLLRHGPAAASRRIVNVSSGAAVHAFPGVAAYGSSKAALRMAGMVLAEELRSPERPSPAPDVSILSYEPGVVDTAMQERARSLSRDEFPWVSLFRQFLERGLLAPAEAPAADIVAFLNADRRPRFSEGRFST